MYMYIYRFYALFMFKFNKSNFALETDLNMLISKIKFQFIYITIVKFLNIVHSYKHSLYSHNTFNKALLKFICTVWRFLLLTVWKSVKIFSVGEGFFKKKNYKGLQFLLWLMRVVNQTEQLAKQTSTWSQQYLDKLQRENLNFFFYYSS